MGKGTKSNDFNEFRNSGGGGGGGSRKFYTGRLYIVYINIGTGNLLTPK